MIEISISEAQKNFTKLLKKSSIIIDKKTKKKKAVLLTYDDYKALIKKNITSISDELDKYTGILDEKFETNDEKYNAIVK